MSSLTPTAEIVEAQQKRRLSTADRQKTFKRLKSSLIQHLLARNTKPYEQILKYIRAHKDIWVVSQGDYISWWQKRENATFSITVSGGTCQIETSLEEAVVERFPGQFLDGSTLTLPNSHFSGEVWIGIDDDVKHQNLLIELLKREGILNYRLGTPGVMTLKQVDVGDVMASVEATLRQRNLLLDKDITAIRQIVVDKLAAHHLPLLRIWYHPRVNGTVMKAVFSPRYDVDRAITNMKQIRALELKYDVPSTLYIRTFCPFYSEKEVEALAASPWCSEIALHGEFVTTARRLGDECKAAKAELSFLEKYASRKVTGVAMHGGEMAVNWSENTNNAVHEAGLLYDTTPTYFYYFPYRTLLQNGELSQAYILSHGVTDVRIPSMPNYGKAFYEHTIKQMEKIYNQNGILVILLHPVYFGLFSYLSRPKNLSRLVKFLWQNFVRK